MTLRPAPLPLFFLLLLVAGCATAPKPAPTATPPVPTLAVPPGAATETAAAAARDAAFAAAAAEIRNVKLFVDALVTEGAQGDQPVYAIDRNLALGRAVVAAAQQALAERGYRPRGHEVTSVGLGLGEPAPRAQLLAAAGALRAALAPYHLSPDVGGTEREGWLAALYAAVRNTGSDGTPAADSRFATYLSPNQNRLEVFVVLTGGPVVATPGAPGVPPHLELAAAVYDSRTGRALWSGRFCAGGDQPIDAAAARRLARQLAEAFPRLAPPTGN